ncbi:hypothetical protein [Tengunoibacter tsumagoiensis]|uniref:Uncharacterized protein n=1 Tax=Tengunoibacter tsumagoiensis TaxID=2014871 RepID=A0A401ZYS3_9CHLR|nr:hypothetical protein [Tengunoibacter tsumagoiensis]GCE11972.1 hypothetical protein KTT_18310 [Tengunoibacter tsumagoiensis]
MSKFLCHCGYIIRDQTDYLPYKAYFFLDADTNQSFERFYTYLHDLQIALDQGKHQEFFKVVHGEENRIEPFSLEDSVATMFGGLFATRSHTLYECENCGRIWLQSHRDMNHYIPYLPEGSMRGVLKADDDKKKAYIEAVYEELTEKEGE